MLRGRFHRPAARRTLAALESADRVLLQLLPGLHRWCGEIVITAVR
jgi:hypothetical protein